MDSPGKRILKWREHLGLSTKQLADQTEIPYSTLKTLENNSDPSKAKPSYDVIVKLRNAFPQLNIDWLFDEGGAEPMTKDGRALAAHPTILPADKELAQAHEPAHGLTVGPLGLSHSVSQMTDAEQAAYWRAKFEQLEQEVARASNREDRLLQMLGKAEASAEAASLRDTVDELAYEFLAPIEVPDIQRFVPRHASRMVVHGLRQGAA